MPHYKDTENKLHFLDDDSFAHFLPAGSVLISDAEAEALRPKPAELTYAQKRAAEYPAIGDQLDALWKGGDAAAEMLTKVQAVKAKYPKEQ
jgi:hypothetical protein